MSIALDNKKRIQNLEKILTETKPAEIATNASSLSVELPDGLWNHPLIETEKDLIDFEVKIEADEAYKNTCLDSVSSITGPMNGKTAYECALILERKMFKNSFWSLTAWTGGRDKKKGLLRKSQMKPLKNKTISKTSMEVRIIRNFSFLRMEYFDASLRNWCTISVV